jgi:hypothetical protein
VIVRHYLSGICNLYLLAVDVHDMFCSWTHVQAVLVPGYFSQSFLTQVPPRGFID